ncbi:retropepsin-like aspartic protease family protein [Gilvibacter sediminis]|uniref:retropepsin-like aspartic protease family protein n=1 Tax=Gilvibacter sediminis TaxID=379071 RepID=UPI00234FFDF6|nr:retropepsin-like aspartic protease [Gilvibacter sediminis]MDC7996659.1 retropepsin-like aspartic protease [Gilvibacter sediminis]
MCSRILFTVFLCSSLLSFAQQKRELVIPFERNAANVMEVQVGLNGFETPFIFDTAASKVSFGDGLYGQLVRAGALGPKNIISKTSTMMANGELADALLIRIDRLALGSLVLEDVDAMVIRGANVPPLLGQSALENFGAITIDNRKKVIKLTQEVGTTAQRKITVDKLRLVACTDYSRQAVAQISQNTFNQGQDALLVQAIEIEDDLPPANAVSNLSNVITIRYFDERDLTKARLFQQKIAAKYHPSQISLQNMAPYFNQPIPDYFEIWINF